MWKGCVRQPWQLISSYILQHVEALEILLQGLCGVQRERLRIHEICLKSGPHLGECFISIFCYFVANNVSIWFFESNFIIEEKVKTNTK